MVTVFRSQLSLEPDINGEIRFCSYMAGNNFNKVEAYSDIFDEYKILRLYHKFRVEKSANVENDTADVDIIH